MDPVSAFTVASAAISAVSSIEAGNEKSAQYKADAAVAERNAGIARQNAQQALQEAGAAEGAHRRAARKALGRTAAALAEAGIGTQGSSAGVIKQSATDAELDALNIRYGGQTEARAYEQEAQGLQMEAGNARRSAKKAKIGGYLGAAGQLLNGASNYRTRSEQVSVLKRQGGY